MVLARLEAHPLYRRYLRFWSEYRAAPEVLALFRLLFFGVLAVDMWLQVDQAPRYGAHHFNVSHLPALDGLLPVMTRPVMAFLFILQAYLAGLVALGGGGRARPRRSDLALRSDLLLEPARLVPAPLPHVPGAAPALPGPLGTEPAPPAPRRPAEKRKEKPPKAPKTPEAPGDWPVRLILVQISIVYVFAAIAKTDPLWWHGRVIELQVSADWAHDLIERMGGFRTVSPSGGRDRAPPGRRHPDPRASPVRGANRHPLPRRDRGQRLPDRTVLLLHDRALRADPARAADRAPGPVGAPPPAGDAAGEPLGADVRGSSCAAGPSRSPVC